MRRKEKFKSGYFFHIFNKSIAGFNIFNFSENSQRMMECLDYYNNISIKKKLSAAKQVNAYQFKNILLPRTDSLLKYISFVIMPDHYHLLVRVLHNNVLSKYIANVENSYCRFFNLKHGRKGPLWQSSFKAVVIKTDEQLLHTSRYFHLNPTTAGLVARPEDWQFSSYKDLITNPDIFNKISEISISNPISYKKFVEDNQDYQKKLKKIKKFIIE